MRRGSGQHGSVADADPLDRATIEQLRDLERSGSPGFLAELADLFVKQTGEQLEAFRRHVVAKDSAGLSRAAHTLKGSCGSLGAFPMMELCRGLETAARASAWADAEAIRARIEREFVRVRGALEMEKNGR